METMQMILGMVVLVGVFAYTLRHDMAAHPSTNYVNHQAAAWARMKGN